jgi:triosephosphate isomerase (TIM)
MRKLIIGNWKMNGLGADLHEIAAIAESSRTYLNVDCGLSLPAALLSRAVHNNKDFSFGGQDCHHNAFGAHTGCISADMLTDAGATMVIIGHSERRSDQHESSANVCSKSLAAKQAGLHVIICVGETESQRDVGEAESVVMKQLADSLPDSASADWVSIAYEPVWAIGTGRIPSQEDVEIMHAAIRSSLKSRFADDGIQMRILYGGSMNGDNAEMLLVIKNVDGGLIGGASLTAAKFAPILAAASAVTQ